MGKTVGIIGAGVTGLIACKYLLQDGFDPVVFELQSSIGGVWTNPPEPTASSGGARSPRPAYQFSDFPWPARSKEAYPNQTKVKLYIESYAAHFCLIDCIKFNSKVLSVDYVGASDEDLLAWTLWGNSGHAFSPNGRWEISVQDTQLHSTNVYEVEFVVVCIGRFKNAPKLPSFPVNRGPDVFKGKVVNVKEYLALDEVDAFDMIEGKKVVIVGSQKTALDIATRCAKENGTENPCTLVITIPPKSAPDVFPKELPLDSNSTTVGKPLPEKTVTAVLSHLAPLLNAQSEDFQMRVEEGSIKLEQSTDWHFSEVGVIIGGEVESVGADIVILATAYDGDHRLSSMFKSPTVQKLILNSTSGETHLYKDCIHPRIPQLAVMATAEGFFNIYTSETRAQWLVEFFQGGFLLPAIKEMEEEVRLEQSSTSQT